MSGQIINIDVLIGLLIGLVIGIVIGWGIGIIMAYKDDWIIEDPEEGPPEEDSDYW